MEEASLMEGINKHTHIHTYTREKQFFVVSFSFTFPRFLPKSGNRLNTSLTEQQRIQNPVKNLKQSLCENS